jgi:1-acyl-sn-glycerol-3-phosphate acyltransferase
MSGLVGELVHAKKTQAAIDALAEAFRHYLRIQVEGLEHVPQESGAIITPNHSGYLALDAVMIAHLIHHDRDRMPKILAHRAFFEWFKALRRLSQGFGLEEVSVPLGVQLLRSEELVLLFPEGESGNFKPSTQRYHLQRFHTGFLRMALLSRRPIVPCIVIGAEETHLNFGNVDMSFLCRGLRMPLPANLLPLPAKWKVKFLPPVDLSTLDPSAAEDRPRLRNLADAFHDRMQRELNTELGRRHGIYF